MCIEHKVQKVILPNEGNKYTYFKDYNKTYMAPLCGFLDFEAFLTSTDSCAICDDTSACTHRTKYLSKHVPFAWSLLIIDMCDNIIMHKQYAGEDSAEKLVECLLDVEDELMALVNTEKPLVMTKEANKRFYGSDQCGICYRTIEDSEKKVRHHHYYTSELICPAHNECNINCHAPNTLPIYAHNLANYDVMFLVQAISNLKRIKRINYGRYVRRVDEVKATDRITVRILPHNTERIRTMKVNSYSILDSMDLFHASLAALVEDLHISKHDFPILAKSKLFKDKSQFDLLLRKGVYPYAFGQSVDDLKLQHGIPDRKYFFSDLSSECVSEEDYKHAMTVYSAFGCENMLDYAMLYLNLDVFLLCEAVRNFRNEIYKTGMIDCTSCLSAAHLSYVLFLKTCKVDIELITDPEMFNFIECNIRGGVSFVCKRYAKKQKNTELTYLDLNNNYGWSQTQLLPISGFKWLTKKKKRLIDWSTIDTSGETGYIVECDLDYPPELHHLQVHNDLPLAPLKTTITYDMLSPYSKGW